MEAFKNDLMDLFKKHNIIALQGSVELHVSPVYHDDFITTRDVLFKFSQGLTDMDEIKELVEKYGVTYTRNYFNIYER